MTEQQLDLDAWQTLMSDQCESLRVKAASIDAGDVAEVMRLRAKWDMPLVHAALQLQKARNKLQPKFSSRWQTLVADPAGAEMSTGSRVGLHKAARFAKRLPNELILDLCCGIGGDTMCLREAGLKVVAVDSDETRAWMAGINANCVSRACDVLAELPAGAFHIDPARRSSSKRLFDLESLQPPVSVLESIARKRRNGAIKLQPGVDASELSQHGLHGELEIISDEGRLVQAVLWMGALSDGDASRTATIVSRSEPTAMLQGSADVNTPPVGPMQRYIHELDPSVERVGLLTTMCSRTAAPMLHPALGLLTSDNAIDDPFLTSFEVLDHFPWKLPRAKDKLKNLGAGIVEVKTRDKQVDPDSVQRELSKPGNGPILTLFVLRFDREVVGIISRRVRSTT